MRLRIAVTFGAVVTTILGLTTATASASPVQPGAVPAATATPAPDPGALADPDSVLPSGWASSSDRAVTVEGDSTGLHVLVASEKAGYAWQTVATLSDAAYETSEWVGQACVTGSGQRAVVVYAPREFSNSPESMDGGAEVAVIDLASGAVVQLPVRSTLDYFSPGCGAGETAAISTLDDDTGQTTVTIIDAAKAAVTGATIATAGQVTSAVPVGAGVDAAVGNSLISLSTTGAQTTLAKVGSTPFRLHPDADGGLAYEVADGSNVHIHRYAGGKDTVIGTGAMSKLQLAGTAGRVFVLGADRAKVRTSGLVHWSAVNAPVDSTPSTTGALVVTGTATASNAEPAGSDSSDAPAVTINAIATARNKATTFTVTPSSGGAGTSLTRITPSKSQTKGGLQPQVAPGNDTTDPDRVCAIARNDPTKQTLQATAAQVEWAVDEAVQGDLMVTRPANWDGSGMPVSWQPQGSGMFPLHQLLNHPGAHVPAQVELGVLAQESNTQQGSPHLVDGETGNTNQGGFYGGHDEHITWAASDCGYGVGQITTGMSLADGSSVYTANQQLAMDTDYASNIAASVNALVDKWNALETAGIIANDDDPSKIENWYLAAWAYNTGIQPASAQYGNTTNCTPGPGCTDNETPVAHWGLGWSNNPANASYPYDRQVFNTGTAEQQAYDEKHPNLWPYQEKVIGWAYMPVARFDYSAGVWETAYLPAAGGGADLPGENTFCASAIDSCNPVGDGPGTCVLSDSHCWWHQPVSWDDNCSYCGSEFMAYGPGASEPSTPTSIYPPDCSTSGLPSGYQIVDDTTVANTVGTCNKTWTNTGSFGFTFASTTPAGCASDCIVYQSKIDFHQIGGSGFGGHLWFAHTQTDPTLKVTGTWAPGARISAWTRVLVHLPDIAANTQQAEYVINTGLASRVRYVDTHRQTNTWVDLGVYQFGGTGTQNVQLSNMTLDGFGSDDIAWDALAFVPLSAKPKDFVVAIGDSFESGEAAGEYEPGTDLDFKEQDWNACRRSAISWPREVTLPGLAPASTIGTLADSNSSQIDFQNVSCSGSTAAEVDGKYGYPYPADTDSGGNPILPTVGPPPYMTDPNRSLAELHSTAQGQYGEMDQIDSGVLSADTNLVLLSAGGNDANFSGAVTDCAMGDCTGNEQQYQLQLAYAVAQVRQLMTDIHAKAPNAVIELVGYPRLFSTEETGTCDNYYGAVNGFQQAETEEMNRLAVEFRDQEVAMVKALGDSRHYHYVDMVNEFGDLGTCQPSGASDINGVLFEDVFPNDNGDFQPVSGENVQACPEAWDPLHLCISRSSFHPTNDGYEVYESAVTSAIARDLAAGQWTLAEGTGSSSTDTGAGGHNLTLTSTTWGNGWVGSTKAITFNGTSSYAAASTSVTPTNASFTVSAWVDLTDSSVERPAVSQNSSTGTQSGFTLEAAGGKWRFEMPSADTASPTWHRAVSTAAPTLNSWTNLIGVYDSGGKTIKLYVNGILQQTVSNVTSFNATGAFRVGRMGSTYWKGSINDVHVYPYVISGNAITALAGPVATGVFPLNYSMADASAYNRTLTSAGEWTYGQGHFTSDPNGDSFSGAAAWQSSPALVHTNTSYTVSAWVKQTATGRESIALSQGDAAGTQVGFRLGYDSASNQWRFEVPATDVASPTWYKAAAGNTTISGLWTHLTGVYDATAKKISLYVNGTLAASVSNVTTFDATGTFQIGDALGGSTLYWSGGIDDVAVYAGALTAAQVAALPAQA